MTGSCIRKAKGGKLLRLTMEWSGSTISSMRIRGDFFAHPEDGFDRLETALAGIRVDEVQKRYEQALVAYGVTVYGLLPEDLSDAVSDILDRNTGAQS